MRHITPHKRTFGDSDDVIERCSSPGSFPPSHAFSAFALSRFIRIAATPENELEFVRVFHSAAAIVVPFYFYSSFMRAKLKNGFFAVNLK